jgi:peptidoglycan/xylan/chitin deacetylase (PgdA/CDA1 family)
MNVLVHPLVRRVAKDTAAAAVHYSGLRQVMARYRRLRAGGRRVLILSYHRVVEDFEGELKRSIPGLLISRETFRRHLEEARRSGYELASLADALDVLAGRRAAARDLCVITFDDGYRDVYRHAFPILKELGVPATVYLPAAFVGTNRRFNHDRLFHLARAALGQRKVPRVPLLEPVAAGRTTLPAALDEYLGEHRTDEVIALIGALEKVVPGPLQPEPGDVMSWDEVREMHRAGVSAGAHTVGHCVLTTETLEVVEREVRGSKEWIERELGAPVRDFAYCNGWYSDVVVQVLARCGFRSAVTTEDYPNTIGGDPFALKRKVLHENFSLGLGGTYSAPLTACHLDDVFGVLGMSHPVPGRRRHSEPRSEDASR